MRHPRVLQLIMDSLRYWVLDMHVDGFRFDLAATLAREFTRIIEENGGLDMNARTSSDATEYFYSLPSNRIELWFLMESQRFLHPVFREFYKERHGPVGERSARPEVRSRRRRQRHP